MTEPEEPPRPEPDATGAGATDEAVEAFETVEAIEAAPVAEAHPADAVDVAGHEHVYVEDAALELEDEDVDEDEDEDEDDVPPPAPAARAVTGEVKPAPPRGARPDLIERREPLYRECRGYRLRLEPADLARLRELPGSRGKSDEEIGEAFFDGQAERLATAIAEDVPAPSEIRVVVDPYSRQAFLALENTIRGILSF